MKKVFERMLELKGEQSVRSFAMSVGIPQQTMDRYLKGREPSLEVIKQLCLVYGCSADWLLGLTERGDQPPAKAATPDNAPSGDCSKCKLLQAHIRELTGRG